jgi:hypothetical protein
MWFGAGRLIADHLPRLKYSLKRLSEKEVAPFKAQLPGSGDVYRFEVRNEDTVDVLDVDIAIDLPTYLSGGPVLVDRSGAESAEVIPAFALVTKTTPDGRSERMPFLPNSFTVAADRIRPGGWVDVVVMTEPFKGKLPESGRYGVLSAIHRHTYFGEAVPSRKAFPIVTLDVGKELLDSSTELPAATRQLYGPVMDAEDLKSGSEWHYQMRGH